MAAHDVSAAAWDRFLADIRVVGKLRTKDYLLTVAAAPPFLPLNIVFGIGVPLSTAASVLVFHGLVRQHVDDVLTLIEMYQYNFFGPRGLDVFLACGSTRLSGHFPGDTSYLDAPPVEVGRPAYANRRREERDLLHRAPRDARAALRDARHAGAVPSALRASILGTEEREQARVFRDTLKADQQQRAAERRRERAQEKLDGTHHPVHGWYRLVVQPLTGAAAEPSDDALARILDL